METEVCSYSNSAILVVIYCFQLKYYYMFFLEKIIYINTYLIYFYEIIMMTKYPEELFKQETVYFKTLF